MSTQSISEVSDTPTMNMVNDTTAAIDIPGAAGNGVTSSRRNGKVIQRNYIE